MRNIYDETIEKQIFDVTNEVFCKLKCLPHEMWDKEELKKLAFKWQELLDLKFRNLLTARSA